MKEIINKVHTGHVQDILRQWPDEFVDCVITSPPYWNLRDYGIEPIIWDGDKNCEHEWGDKIIQRLRTSVGPGATVGNNIKETQPRQIQQGNFCLKCNAWQGSLGLEPTPELYIKHLLEIFDEIKRVLKKTGTCWVNLGDSYSGSGGAHKPHHANPGISRSNERDGVPHCGENANQKMLNEIDASWLAALIDGEGSIFINTTKQKNTSWCDSYFPTLAIEMKDKGMIEKTKSLTGLSSVCTTKDEYYRWAVAGQQASKVLHSVYQYLILKKKQAKVAIALAWETNRNGDKYYRISNNRLGNRKNLKQIVSALNQRKVVDVSFLPEPNTYNKHSSRSIAKSLVGIPEMFVLGMRDRGWIRRNTIIWYKRNCMPSSAKDRFTVDFEYVYFFTKSGKYWFEQQFEEQSNNPKTQKRYSNPMWNRKTFKNNSNEFNVCPSKPFSKYMLLPQSRNKRCVWNISTQPFPEAHFATFPQSLVEPMIRAGCPEFVCKKCGKAREKIFKSKFTNHTGKINSKYDPKTKEGGAGRLALLRQAAREQGQEYQQQLEFLGYTDCGCNAGFEPGITLDPFSGSGTTLRVAEKLNRWWIGIDLNPKYKEMSDKRLTNVQKVLL